MPDYKKLIRKKSTSKKNSREKRVPNRYLGKIFFLFIFAALIVALGLRGKVLLVDFAGFKINEVSVINQTGLPVSHPQDFFKLEHDKDLNLLNLNIEKVCLDILARHPELADVTVRKQFPSKLLVVVKERQPAAIIVLTNFYLVDEQAFILPYRAIDGDLPKIVGIHPRQIALFTQSQSLSLKKALELVKELKKNEIYPEYKVDKIDVSTYTDILLYFKNKVEVKMGQGDFAKKTILLSKVLAELKKNETLPKYIDMRFGQPIVKP